MLLVRVSIPCPRPVRWLATDNTAEIASQDAVYVLAYSVIMLNTDLHNPQNRKRMTIDDYKRNLRGVNDGKDFDPEYLAGIHESLKKKEIILPEEHSGQAGFEYAWKSLMQRTRTAGKSRSFAAPCGRQREEALHF